MIKNKNFSAYNDFKTGLLYKIMISIGLIFLILFIFLKIFSLISINDNGLLKYFYDLSLSNFPGIIISFSILLLSFGLILYFFYRQFSKLAEIADEIEHDNETKNKK